MLLFLFRGTSKKTRHAVDRIVHFLQDEMNKREEKAGQRHQEKKGAVNLINYFIVSGRLPQGKM